MSTSLPAIPPHPATAQSDTGRARDPIGESSTMVCKHCGESYERVTFYAASCTPEEEFDGQMPGPAREHEWEVLSRDEFERRVG